MLFALAEPYAAPTPAAKSPGKSLKQPPPGVGPYVLDIVDFNRKYILTKNPNFDLPGIPKGNFDKITGQVSDSVTKMTQDVIDGEARLHDRGPDGRPACRRSGRSTRTAFARAANPPNTYYFFLNVTTPAVRQAGGAPGGQLRASTATRSCGSSAAGCSRAATSSARPCIGLQGDDCTYGDPDGKPDIEKAKQLVKESGYEGEKVTVWTNNKDPRPAIADYYRDVLNQIGFEADVKTLDQQVYFEQIGQSKTKAQTGFTDWFQDYPHPGDFIESLAERRRR